MTPSRELVEAAKNWERQCRATHEAWGVFYNLSRGVEHAAKLRDAAHAIARAELKEEA